MYDSAAFSRILALMKVKMRQRDTETQRALTSCAARPGGGQGAEIDRPAPGLNSRGAPSIAKGSARALRTLTHVRHFFYFPCAHHGRDDPPCYALERKSLTSACEAPLQLE